MVSASFLGAHGRVVVDPGGGARSPSRSPARSIAGFTPGDRVTLRPTGEPALAVAVREAPTARPRPSIPSPQPCPAASTHHPDHPDGTGPGARATSVVFPGD